MYELKYTGAQSEDIVLDIEITDENDATLTANVFEFVVWDAAKTVLHRQTDAQITRVTDALRLSVPKETTLNLDVGRYPLNLWMTMDGIKTQVAFGELTISEGQS